MDGINQKKKRKEAAEPKKLLATIPKFSSYFGVRASSSQSSATSGACAPEDQAKQEDEPLETREDEERETDAVTEEQAVQQHRRWRISQMIWDSGVKSTLTPENIGPKRVQKTANTLTQSLKRVPDDTQESRSSIDAQRPSSCVHIRSMVKNSVDMVVLLAFDREVVLLCMQVVRRQCCSSDQVRFCRF